jgi:hypothetical protein
MNRPVASSKRRNPLAHLCAAGFHVWLRGPATLRLHHKLFVVSFVRDQSITIKTFFKRKRQGCPMMAANRRASYQ